MTYHSNDPTINNVCPCGMPAEKPFYTGPWYSRRLIVPELCPRCYDEREEKGEFDGPKAER
jgi:uncharacterized protein CbrC (UPF0167 family)